MPELQRYPGQPLDQATLLEVAQPFVLMPFLVHTPAGLLHLISTATVFGSPTDITLQELALGTFFARQRRHGEDLALPGWAGAITSSPLPAPGSKRSRADLSNSSAVPIQR